jgi:hypothetical protein
MTDVNSRIQVLDFAPANPGTCILCGSAGGDSRKFIDFGFQFDMYGAVYFCSFCMESTVETLGYVSKLDLEVANDKLIEIQNIVGKYIVTNQALKHALVAVFTSSFDRNIDIDELLSVLLANVEKQLEAYDKAYGSEPVSDETSSEQRPKHVPAARKKLNPEF